MNIKTLQNIKRIIVHGNCPDGMSSAILLYDALSIEPEFHIHGMDAFQNLKITPNTLFCDICPPEHLVQQFVEADGIVLDHHRAAEPFVKMFGERGVFADEKKEPGISGASLAYREVWLPMANAVGKALEYPYAKRFARLAGIRDTWQKHEEDWDVSCHQAAGLTFYPWSHWKNEIDQNSPHSYYADRYFQFSNEMDVGKLIFENRLSKARVCASEAHVADGPNSLKVAIFNDHDRLTSDVADMLREDGVNVIAGFFYSKTSKDSNYPVLCYSIRSDGSFDVSKFAESFGGGGHTKAAGYTKKVCMDDDPFSLFLDDLYSYGG